MSEEHPQDPEGQRPPQYPGPSDPPENGPASRPEQPRHPVQGQPYGQGYPPGYGQYGQPPYGQPPYGQPQYGGQYGQPPYGQPPYGQPPHGQPAYAQPSYGYPPAYGSGPVQRPGKVLAAAIVTWVFSGLTVLAAIALLIGAATGGEAFYDELVAQSDGALSRTDARAALIVVAVIFLIWCLSAIVLAFLVLKQQNWARITLAVSAVFTALFSLVSIASLISILTLAASIAVLVLLFTGDTNAWFRNARGAGGPSYSPPPEQPRPPSGAW